MQWYLHVLRNYVNFSGRARRQEYWMFALISTIISIVLSFIGKLIGMPTLLSGLYALAILLPSIGVSVRRLHDIGKSGWWLLIAFVPFVGAIVLLIFACIEGQPGTNEYGPNPKETSMSAVATA